MKAPRQRLIADLIARRAIASQAELARLLRERGEPVTQATLSRDLEEIGAFKARENGRSVYRLPDDPAEAAADWLVKMLREFATSFDASGNIVIVRTPPGGAGPVARAIDAAAMPDVLGTVAGDDTILVVSRAERGGAELARALRALAHAHTAKEA